jgi:acyl-CoA thioester hydrolase
MVGTSLPTAEQVRQLPALLKATVDPEWIDVNGHMNVRHYLELCAQGTSIVCYDQVGIDDDYRAERRMGVFTAEHHLSYFSELHLGEELSVHVRTLERSDKVVHMLGLLVDDTHDRLANTLEVTLVHVDMDARSAVPIPDDIAAGFDREIAVSEALDWAAPVSGAMGVRRRR